MTETPATDPFEARGLESLYRERARWGRWGCRIDRAYRRRVQEAIERLEYYGKLKRLTKQAEVA